MQTNNVCYFGIKAFDDSTPWFVTKVMELVSDWSRISQTSIVLCSSSLHQLSKTSEIVTGWESSIVVLTLNMQSCSSGQNNITT